MNKKLTLLLVAFIAALTFTSCSTDDDADTADYFVGYWEGKMGTYFYDELGYGTDYYYSQLDIQRTSKYGGWGRERDYNGYHSFITIDFQWTVQDGYIYFHYSNGAEVALDFEMDGSYDGTTRMRAIVYDTQTGNAVGNAELYRINSWYDNWYDNSYWAKPDALPQKEEE